LKLAQLTEVLLVAQPLVEDAQPDRPHAFGEILVIGLDGSPGVADAWLGHDLGDGGSGSAFPAALVDASTAAHQTDALTGLDVLAHRGSAAMDANGSIGQFNTARDGSLSPVIQPWRAPQHAT
jgi:hypothetical protein